MVDAVNDALLAQNIRYSHLFSKGRSRIVSSREQVVSVLRIIDFWLQSRRPNVIFSRQPDTSCFVDRSGVIQQLEIPFVLRGSGNDRGSVSAKLIIRKGYSQWV